MGHVRLFKLGVTATVLGAVVVGAAGSANAVAGPESADPATYPFLAKVEVVAKDANQKDDHQRGCSGTLVSPQWVLTTRSCLGEPGAVQDGKPPIETRVTLAGGTKGWVTTVKTHPQRDLALLRLAQRVRGVTPATIATTAPATGAELRAAGFGRTSADWVPLGAHLGTFTVSSSTATTLDIDSTDSTLCLGDTGAPLLTAAKQVAGVASASWQGGCMLVDETRRGGVAQRVDALATWVRDNTPSCKTAGRGMTTNQQTSVSRLVDFTGDCNDDLGGQFKDGNVRVMASTGDVSGNLKSHLAAAVARNNFNLASVQRTFTGDFNGDGLADFATQNGDGKVWLYPSTGDTSAPGKLFGTGVVFKTDWLVTNVEKIFTGDFNGDGVTDIGAQYKTGGNLHVWLLNRASLGTVIRDKQVGSNWGTANVDRFFIGDVNGDGKDDLIPQYKAAPQTLGAFAATGRNGASDAWFEPTLRTLGSGWGAGNVARIVVDDFNGDGVDDIGGQYVEKTEMYVWFRGRNWDTIGSKSIGTGWGSTNVARILTGDVNGDGSSEVIANYGTDTANPNNEWATDLRAYWVAGGATIRLAEGWSLTEVPRVF